MSDSETTLDKVRAQFLGSVEALLTRDVRRLERFGAIGFDEAPYHINEADFLDRVGKVCATTQREVDYAAFDRWYEANAYERLFPAYVATYPDSALMRKKAFEHWLSLTETRDAPGGTFVDVGCATSPFWEVTALDPADGAEICYRADLPLPEYGYKPGIHGNVIGCSADAIPLDDASVARIFSHNAIEHFEGGSYTGFFREAGRLLQPGGVLYVCPLFVAAKSFVYVAISGIYRRLSFPNFVKGIDMVYSESVGQPYALQIDPDFLRDRIVEPLRDVLRFEVIHYTNDRARNYGVRYGLIAHKL